MKNIITKTLFIGLLFLLPFTVSAQASVVGDWKSEAPNEQGKMEPFKVSLKVDGTYTIDFGINGSVEIEGKYSVEGDKMTIEDNACTEGKGVYTFVMTDTTNTLTEVTDPCKRGGPTGKVVFTRMK